MSWENFPRKIQCSSCTKYWPEGLFDCTCGICLHVFTGAEAQGKESIRHLVNSVLRRKKELFARCKAWTDLIAVRSLQSERVKSTRRTDLSSPSHGPKNIVNVLESLMCIDFSYTAARKERQRYENNNTLGLNRQGPQPGPMQNRADFRHAFHQLIALKKQVEKPNPHIPEHMRFRQRPLEERERLEQQWKRWGWNTWSQSSSSSSTCLTPQEWQELWLKGSLLKCVLTPFCASSVGLGADLGGRLRGRPRTP